LKGQKYEDTPYGSHAGNIGLCAIRERRQYSDRDRRSDQRIQSPVGLSGRAADRLRERFEADSFRPGAATWRARSVVESRRNNDRSGVEPESDVENRRKVAAELKEDRATEMEGTSREEAVANFLSGKGWYRGADVDRLSEEEASIIAARLVRFVKAKTTVATDKAELLQRALDNTLRKDLTGENARLHQKPRRLEDVARDYLDPEQIKVLKEAIKDEEAIENGENPVPKEG
jgi:hypothetical protein